MQIPPRLILVATLAAIGCGSHSATPHPGEPTPDGGRPIDAGADAPDVGATHDSATVDTGDVGATPDSAPGDTGAADAPPHVVGDCSGLAAEGVWEDVTPPPIKAEVECGNAANCGFGVSSFVLDPSTSGTLYLGTDHLGVWKTTDCGATWAHVDTGTNGAAVDEGANWTFAIDPSDPDVLYTCSGYGTISNGAWKSTNGGVDWQELWPPQDAANAPLAASFLINFISSVSVDPFDHTHLLLTFHEGCCTPATCGSANPTYSSVCMVESHDRGANWKLIRGESTWVGDEGQSAWFLDSSDHWLWASASNGIWQTTDDGATWSAVLVDGESHGGGQLYRAHDGTYYLAGRTGILSSPDATTWTLVPNSGTLMSGLTGNGTTMWAGSGFPDNAGQRSPAYEPFLAAAENNGQTWTPLTSPLLADSGPLAYDADHHVLYSSNLYGGFWRVVLH